MELGNWLKHAYAISIVVLLHINASLSLGHNHANVTRCIERERDALLAVKRDLVDNHNRLSSWGSGSEAQNEDCCRWEGVYCDDQTGHVLQLDLGADPLQYGEFAIPALQGKISPQLIQLHDLTYLNLSHNDFNGSQIPAFIGSLTSLRYLDLSRASFGGQIPSHAVGNLTHLQYLDLSEYYFPHSVENLNWLPHLSSLKYLDLSGTNIGNVFDWLETVNKLPNLRSLSLCDCGLPPSIFSSLYDINSSKSLASVGLSDDFYGATAITSSIFKWLCNYNITLVHLDLSSTQLSGWNPDVFRNMRSLEHLDLYQNQLTGLIPDGFRNMSSLAHLDLSSNQLTGLIPDGFRNMSSLAHLDLSSNQLTGLIPDGFRNMSSLAHLDLSYNLLEGGIPKSISQLCSLQSLRIFSSSLDGLFSEFVQGWSTCPQNSLQFLDLSSNDLAGSFPNLTNFSSLKVLSLSENQLSGMVPDSIGKLSFLEQLELRQNELSGMIPESIGQLSLLGELDLSENLLSGIIPESIVRLSSLRSLYLSGNQLSGRIPKSIGQLSLLGELDLSENLLSGIIPESIGRLSSLRSLYLSGNQLSGRIPQSIGQLSNLFLMNLSMNSLKGVISETHFSNLSGLHELDLSSNLLGFNVTSYWVPPFQLSSLKLRSCNVGPHFPEWLRTQILCSDLDISHAEISDVLPNWFWGHFANIQTIDLSSNRITGEIPSEISHLVGLVSLNLSRNHLTGQITPDIGKLQSLDSLDISRNQIDGAIPTSLAQISQLAYLDLSYNKLSGEIPTGTQLQRFDPSFYAGNPQLCGLPLEKICDPDEIITQGFYIGLELGFAVGFWGVCGSLIFKRSWRYSYYKFLNALNDWLYVKVTLIRHKLKNMLSR